MAKKKSFKPAGPDNEPGFKKMPVPGPNDLRPGMRDVTPAYGAGRRVLDYADGVRQIHNIGGSTGWPSTSPASAEYTVGLRKSPKEAETPNGWSIIQPGIARH